MEAEITPAFQFNLFFLNNFSFLSHILDVYILFMIQNISILSTRYCWKGQKV